MDAGIVKLVTGPAVYLLRRRTFRLRVAFSASRRARAEDINFGYRAAYRWISRPDTQGWLIHGERGARDSSVAAVRWVLGSPGTDEVVVRVVQIVVDAILGESDPSKAVAISNQLVTAAVQSEAEKTREAVSSQGESVIERIDASRTIGEALGTLHPWHAQRAKDLIPTFPVVERVVDSLARTQNRKELLDQWSSNSPSWLQENSDWEVQCFVASLANDFGARDTAVERMAEAIDLGAFPRAYWVARLVQFGGGEESPYLTEMRSIAHQHPLAETLVLALDGDEEAALEALENWEPETAPDGAMQAILSARLKVSLGELSQGITEIESAAREFVSSTGVLMLAAELLLQRAVRGDAANKYGDARRALEYCVRARNARRAWGGDSTAAAVLALRAANVAGDTERAWRISQEPPEGEATEGEACSSALRQEAALTAVLTRRDSVARAMLGDVRDPFTKHEIEAILAMHAGDDAQARTHWLAAWEAATQDGDKLLSAMGMAEAGADLPDMIGLDSLYPKQISEIRAMHRAVTQPGDRQQALRANAHESPLLTVRYAEHLRDEGNLQAAARALEAGANRWSHPQLMAMAADAFYRSGNAQAALEAALASLQLGGTEWAGASDSHALLAQIYADAGDWTRAAQSATALLAADRWSEDARWALVKCHLQEGKPEDAWRVLSEHGEAARPRDAEEARIWIQLHVRFAPKRRFLTSALEVLEAWTAEEEVFGTFISVLYMGLEQRGFEPGEADLVLLQEARDQFLQRFPESGLFRAFEIPEGHEVETLTELVRSTHNPAVDALLDQVQKGELPLGTAALATRKTYLEAAVRRAAGRVYSTEPAWAIAPPLAIPIASCVIDTTAARTLSLLPESAREALLGIFGELLTSDRLYRDAINGRDVLRLHSTLSVSWDAASGSLSAVEISQEDADRLVRDAENIVGLLDRAKRKPVPDLKDFDAAMAEEAWLTGVQLSLGEGVPFWCDDRILCGLTRSMGGIAFSTTDLVRALALAGQLAQNEMDVVQGVLIHDYHIDLGFNTNAMLHAATMDAWRARGAALAVTRPFAWQDPPSAMQFILQAGANSRQDPIELRAWCAAASTGVIAAADDAVGRTENIRVLLRQFLAGGWVGPKEVPFILEGVRMALKDSPDVDDPAGAVMEEIFKTFAHEHDAQFAQGLLLWLFGQCSEDDKRLVARTVLMSGTAGSVLHIPTTETPPGG